MNRSTFLKSVATGLTGLWFSTRLDGAAQYKPGGIDQELVKEFVTAGHNDLDKVKAMLQEIPNLIHARYDWGKGDYEEAIEGAGHLGKKEIANYLIEQGARVNLFVLTMLGKTNLVIPVLEEYPALINAKGAHGFTLLHHAKVGGDSAREIYDYLVEKGLEKTKFSIK